MQGERAAVGAQHWSAAVREVRAGPLPGNCQRAPLKTKIMGQTHREGQRLVQVIDRQMVC